METIIYGLGLVLVPFIWIAVITGIISIVRGLNTGSATACEETRAKTFNSTPVRPYSQRPYAA